VAPHGRTLNTGAPTIGVGQAAGISVVADNNTEA
jgi:hypothetical protein